MEVKTIQTKVKIFADGTWIKQGVGTRAILKVHGRSSASVGFRLGNTLATSIVEAELVAILLATQLILRLRYIEDATILSDSQLAIVCVEGVSHGAPKKLVSAVRNAMGRIGSRGLLGNTQAEQEAKLAARGEKYPHDFIPSFLQTYDFQITRATCKEIIRQSNHNCAEW
ncbi:hypothetical protein FRC07_014812 [Ceratobasidium sp. 392]|nr:hypothetical protein FRC07_014812 [Ceratobasidium sp. 392]